MPHQLSVAFLLAILTTPLRLSAQRADTGAVQLAVPKSIGVFEFDGRHDYPDRSLGVLVRYQRPVDSLRVDVFAYPGPDLVTGCALACARDALDREITDFVGAFPELIKRQYVDTIFLVSDGTLTPSPNDRWALGRHLVLGTVSKGQSERSDFYLYYLRGVRIKLRATYVADSSRIRGVAEFAAAVVPAFLGRPPSDTTSAVAQGAPIQISATLAVQQPLLFRRVITALGQLGFTIADSSSSLGRVTTAPSFAWPKGSENESWHGTESPGVVVTVTTRAQGDSTLLQIDARSPVVAGWKDSSIASRLQMLSTLFVANAIREQNKKP